MSLKSTFKSQLFYFLEKVLKVHITPVHFYSPIPHVGSIEPSSFSKINDCVGLDFQEVAQIRFIEDIAVKYADEFCPSENIGLSKVDAYFLYSMIRNKAPKLFIEIGSGESTKISLKALEANKADGNDFKFIAVEPYPKSYLKDLESESFTLLVKKVQEVPVSMFHNADILFIDSSHVSKFGSDVNYELMDIVPLLKVGSIIHWHDIMIPGDYPKSWVVDNRIFWNESYMVHIFMLFNKTFKIIWASKYMQIKYPELLAQKFTFFSPNQQMSSFWIERIA
jgi:hypothetical protein